MKSLLRYAATAFAALAILAPAARAVELASDFTLTHRATGKPIRRDDFNGKIIFLDFFAYWCPPCATSSPVVESDIAAHYRLRGGTLLLQAQPGHHARMVGPCGGPRL